VLRELPKSLVQAMSYGQRSSGGTVTGALPRNPIHNATMPGSSDEFSDASGSRPALSSCSDEFSDGSGIEADDEDGLSGHSDYYIVTLANCGLHDSDSDRLSSRDSVNAVHEFCMASSEAESVAPSETPLTDLSPDLTFRGSPPTPPPPFVSRLVPQPPSPNEVMQELEEEEHCLYSSTVLAHNIARWRRRQIGRWSTR